MKWTIDMQVNAVISEQSHYQRLNFDPRKACCYRTDQRNSKPIRSVFFPRTFDWRSCQERFLLFNEFLVTFFAFISDL